MKSFFSQEACNIILRLLEKDPDTRLGAKDDAREVMKHPFFSDIDWTQLEKKKVDPHFKPDLSEDKLKYFNTTLDKQERLPLDDENDRDTEENNQKEDYKPLAGFTYTNPSFKERRLNAEDVWPDVN